MKAVRVIIPLDKLEVVTDLLDKLKINYTLKMFREKAEIEGVINPNQTSIVLEELKGIGVGSVYGKILLSHIDFQIDSKTQKFEQRSRSISIDEMINNTKGLGLLSMSFILLNVLAGFLASFGLIADNVIIVISSMIIAPLLGPIALSVIGTLLPNNIYSKRAIIAGITGLSICIFVGFLVGLVMPISGEMPNQILIRTEPGIPDIIFAIASGFAAGLFIIRGESTNLVGVAVAASLAPPAANVGVLLAKMEYFMAFGSFLLLVLNVIAIYAACTIVFWSSQTFVRGGSISERQFRIILKTSIVRIVLSILILIAIIVGIILGY